MTTDGDGFLVDYTIRIHHENDSYWADVVELPGVFAAGTTLDELRASLEEGISLYLSSDRRRADVRVDRAHDAVVVEQRFVVRT
ncbi:type II toxin-antitoxin system HicB family antitoxin [Nocardiopsis sediminis]|uniref:Type II toxin-antitoxin system HicB family antitoxin n=1 Tax=Nocardiopsis sediminis TaxID=1778267 RepID=A0ABV8FNP9_9ACTN